MSAGGGEDPCAGLRADGWEEIADEGFVGHVGPFFSRSGGGEVRFCFPTGQKHANRRGVVQGGALMTFADRVMGTTARAASGAPLTATVQVDFQFTDAVAIGDLVEATPVVVRLTHRLVFLRVDLQVAKRTVAAASGIFKKLGADRGA